MFRKPQFIGRVGEDVTMQLREESFARVLREFMGAAGVNTSELAKLVGVDRHTVDRWLDEARTTKPHRKQIDALPGALRRHDLITQEWRDLTEEEVNRLRAAAGYPRLESTEPADLVKSGDRCHIYSYAHSRTAFPTRWAERVIEAEQAIRGRMDLVLSYISEVTRPREYYDRSYHRELYESELVDAYATLLDVRRRALLARLQGNEVRHLYSLIGVENYLLEKTKDERHKRIPIEIRRRQAQQLIDWLELRNRNFRVALTLRPLPANFEIVGRATVFLEFDQQRKFVQQQSIMGIEIVGEAAAAQFEEQVHLIWSSEDTFKDTVEVKTMLGDLIAGRSVLDQVSKTS